jgi:hypothetical protein
MKCIPAGGSLIFFRKEDLVAFKQAPDRKMIPERIRDLMRTVFSLMPGLQQRIIP